MNNIFQALNSGYPPQQILAFISKIMPQFADPIRKATQAGYNAKNILGFLSKSMRNDIKPGMSESEIHSANRRHDAQMTKNGLKMAASAVALPIAGIAARSALSRALPSSLQGLVGQASPSISGMPQTNSTIASGVMNPSGSALGSTLQQPQAQNIQSPSPQQPPIAGAALQPTQTNIPQPQQITQAIPAQRDIQKNIALIKNLKEDKRISNLISGGMEPKDIAALIKKVAPKDVSKALESAEGGIEGAIEDFSQTLQQPAAQLTQPIETTEQMAPEAILQPEVAKKELPIEPKRIEKASIVSSPQGIGEVKHMRNGKALVEVEGKLHKVDESDLETPEFTEDEIADAYDNLMAKIPEPHKSGFIQWAGYDEDRNVLGFIPRGGKYEELTNITPEEAEKIKEGKGVARTTGETREGLWLVGEDTRGGIISQIIHDRKKRRKAEEEKQLKLSFDMGKKEKEDRGMKPLFDELAYARSLSKERDRKKALQERQRKKEERDEERKRKK